MRIRYSKRRFAWEVVEGTVVLASFDRLWRAEAWQIVESCRRESEAAAS